MKVIEKEKIVIRDSFILPFAGGEIWCTELDSLSIYTDVVKNKFLNDMDAIRKPSSPAAIGINLTNTLIDTDIADLIIKELNSIKRSIRVAIIGINIKGRMKFNSELKKHEGSFVYKYFTDPEKAKEWLILNKQ
jgi:hypothetical protein